MQMTELPPQFFAHLATLEASYLRETDPIRQSGFGGGPERWRDERQLILDAVDHDGDFMDVGCANGYLLECLVEWGHARQVRLIPYGVDVGRDLVRLARERLPQYAANFWIANAWDWTPPRKFHYVYTVYDCVPDDFLQEYIRRLLARYVAPGGRLIIGAYGSHSRREAARDITQDILAAGVRPLGSSLRGDLPVSRVAWLTGLPAARDPLWGEAP
jgi:2-polyprenyl-3-methyl-5-hydroxy-6-metoxy-1,4-benzoquinol methylase